MITNANIASILVAFVITTVFIAALRPVASAVGLVDKPGGRKSHVGEVPVIGGIAMFVGIFTALTLVPTATYSFSPLFAASSILLLVGVVDDRYLTPASVRISAQIAVVLIMVFGANLSLSSIGDPFGTGEIFMGRFTVFFTMLVALTMINAYNLADGTDGLAGSLAMVALLAVSAAVVGTGHPAFTVSLIVAAAISGFLLFNLPAEWNRRARCFMGDAGSTLLGFLIVWITLGISTGSDRVISPVHCLWFASIPIYDLLTCFIRRIANGKSPFSPGRDHFHHILKRGGFSMRETLGVLTAIQVGYAGTGVLAHQSDVPDVVMFVSWSVLGLMQSHLIRLIAKYRRAYLLHARRSVPTS